MTRPPTTGFLAIIGSVVLVVACSAGTATGPSRSPSTAIASAAASAAATRAVAQATVAPTAAPTPIDDGAINADIDVGGRTLHVTCSGTAPIGVPTIVLISGLGGPSTVWSAVRPRLAVSTRVCAFDRAGIGSSDPAVDTPISTDDQTDDLDALLDGASIDGPYLLVAHSLGAWIATTFTSRHLDEVEGLVLVDPRGPDVSAGWTKALPPSTAGEPDSVTGKRDHIVAYETDPESNDEHQDMPTSEAEVRALLNADGRLFGARPVVVLAADGTADAWSDLPDAPRGGWDRAWVDGQKKYASESSNGKLVVVANSGHTVQDDQPTIVIETILAMLKSRSSS